MSTGFDFFDENEDLAQYGECDDEGCDDVDHEETCSQCMMFGDYQCPEHGEATIQAQREYSEHFAVREALETLLAMPETWHGVEWQRLLDAAAAVLKDMEARGM